MTVGLAILQSTTLVAVARAGQLFGAVDCPAIIPNRSIHVRHHDHHDDRRTGLIMWLGEIVTEKGVGNGMSILIFTSVAAASRPRCGRSSRPKGGG
jgi:preprotein translocase subunit SecY